MLGHLLPCPALCRQRSSMPQTTRVCGVFVQCKGSFLFFLLDLKKHSGGKSRSCCWGRFLVHPSRERMGSMGAAGSAAGPGVPRGQGPSECKRRCLKAKYFCKHLQGNGPKGRGIILSGVAGKQQALQEGHGGAAGA